MILNLLLNIEDQISERSFLVKLYENWTLVSECEKLSLKNPIDQELWLPKATLVLKRDISGKGRDGGQ